MPYRPANTIVLWTIGFLYTGLALVAIYAALNLVIFLQYPDFYDINTTKPLLPGEQLVGMAMMGVGLLMLLVHVPTVVMFCVWLYRMGKNTRALGAQNMKYSAGWAVGSFFIPILNLFRPFQSVREIEQASNPHAGPTNWYHVQPSGKVGMWWAFWLLSSFMTRVVTRMSLSNDSKVAHTSSLIGLVEAGITIVATLLAIRVVRYLHRQQEEKVRIQPQAVQATCLGCGYDLRGTPGVACPECGAGIPGRGEYDDEFSAPVPSEQW